MHFHVCLACVATQGMRHALGGRLLVCSKCKYNRRYTELTASNKTRVIGSQVQRGLCFLQAYTVTLLLAVTFSLLPGAALAAAPDPLPVLLVFALLRLASGTNCSSTVNLHVPSPQKC